MENDPFYRQIVERLNGHLDDELFEACATDLLVADFPGLAPYRGGDDSGMDGAIPDWEGEPFPLVVTTSEDAIGNLTGNLNKIVADGHRRRKAVFATSQQLTVRRINNLHKRAEELGFVLVNVHAQDWFARALYRHPEWCQDLLGLSGKPAALSTIPATSRPLLDQPVIGRDEDLAWLGTVSGDRLLIGQPGCGKTFLLYQFAKAGGGLFVVSEDVQEIANGIRSKEPKTLIVDDAHTKIELLRELVRLRREIGADFCILANSWPGERDQIVATLNLPLSAIHELSLLERGEIVAVIKGAGVPGPARLMREIVDQAGGCPGLAVTLAHACLSGGARELVLGDVLSRSVRSFFVPTLGREVVDILATFAIGGDAGMSKEVVAQALGLPLVELRSTVAHLAAGGILFERAQHLAVFPPRLRHALVRDVFFQGFAVSLPFEPLMLRAPSLWDVADTLIGAYTPGGQLPIELVWYLLVKIDSDELWQKYASMGKSEVTRVVKQLPWKTTIVANAALHYAPETVLPILFGAAVSDNRELHSNPDHPMRLIQDWIKSGEPGTGAAIRRRGELLRAARQWLAGFGDVPIGLQALQIAFAPAFMDHYSDPGQELQPFLRFGSLTAQEIGELQDLWPTAHKQLRSVDISDWKSLCRMVEDWVYPGRNIAPLSDETHHVMKQFGMRLLQDIVALANERPGILRWARQLVSGADLDVAIPSDSEFDVLYPIEDLTDWETAETENVAAARQLAQNWIQYPPDDIASRLARFEKEAQIAQLSYPRYSPLVCSVIAEQVGSPLNWVMAMKRAGVPGDLIYPFLKKAIEAGENGWVRFAEECLEHSVIQWVTISAVLELDQPPEDLLDHVLLESPHYTRMIEVMCLRGQVPITTVRRLLRQPDVAVASAAAHGEWLSDPKKHIRTELMDDWRKAVVSTDQEDYWLREVLCDDPSLAFDWLQRQMTNGTMVAIREDKTIAAAVCGLSRDVRKALLNTVPASWEYEGLVKQLVGDDLDLFHVLLDRPDMERFHLVPLFGNPDERNWIERATLALDRGYSPESIALAVHGVGVFTITWSGDESKLWDEWMQRFAVLQSHQDERIRYIGEIGQNRMTANRARASEEERLEAIYGFDDSRSLGQWSRVRR